jgi:hypothetical protein
MALVLALNHALVVVAVVVVHLMLVVVVHLIHVLHALVIRALHVLLTHVQLVQQRVHVLLSQNLVANAETLAVAKNESP